MAGIYIHIPFCKKACHYCDFHFSTQLHHVSDMVWALGQELLERKDYLDTQVDTLYLGGGTPSLLRGEDLLKLIGLTKAHYHVANNAEITLEANPEDLTKEKCESLKATGINRLSIGVQTFSDAKLKWMNRAHSSEQSLNAIKNAREAGFSNLSLDLMYALPTEDPSLFQEDLRRLMDCDPAHISLYGLTIEEKTVFGKWKQKEALIEMPEEQAAQQYLNAVEMMAKNNYLQYEVSNFSREGFRSQHNSAYWRQEPYLGIGPGAHSYNQTSRSSNVRNNALYIKALQKNTSYMEEEILTLTQQLNEHILTGLRTIEGIDLKKLEALYHVDLLQANEAFLRQMESQGLVRITGDALSLSTQGFLVADEIAIQLFL